MRAQLPNIDQAITKNTHIQFMLSAFLWVDMTFSSTVYHALGNIILMQEKKNHRKHARIKNYLDLWRILTTQKKKTRSIESR